MAGHTATVHLTPLHTTKPLRAAHKSLTRIVTGAWNYSVVYGMEIGQPIASRVSFEMLAKALESINDAVVIATPSDEILYVNPAFERLYGYAPEEVLGSHSSILWSERNPKEVTNDILPTTLAEDCWTGELYNRTKSGTEIAIHLTTSKLLDERGKLIGFIGVAHDITLKKQHEEQLRKQHLTIAKRNTQLYEELNYARRLQAAILPSQAELEKHFPEAFVLSGAKHVLSGEFFWYYQQMDRTFLAVVHTGVSGAAGAFLSVLIHTLLTQIVREEMTIAPNQVVSQLGEGLQDIWTETAMDEPLLDLIQQQLGVSASTDAQEAASKQSIDFTLQQLRGVFCSFTKNFRAVRYTCIGMHAGYYRKNKWTPFDHEPPELFGNPKLLLNPEAIGSHQLPLQLGDTLYFFSEGLLQQQGPKNPTPFGETQLLSYLGAFQQMNLVEQQRQLENNLRIHRSGGHPNEDYLCLGIRL